MTPLAVIVDREIRFYSNPDLPVSFRKAIAMDNTFPNPLAHRKNAPPVVEAFYHNPFTKEVALPRAYWPQFLARAEEFRVTLQVTELREDYPAVIHRQVAVDVTELGYGLDLLRMLLSNTLPVDWGTVQLRVTATRYRPVTEPEDLPDRKVELIPNPFPWEESGGTDQS